jgi:hypothetical protein
MNKVINQFRRLYDDKGLNDHDFSDQEARLREARDHLTKATDALMRASERLNAAALVAMPVTKH